MKTSEQINELVGALTKAQGQFKPVQKTGTNPMFKSKYATFDSLVDAVREALSVNGLAFSQLITSDEDDLFLETVLFHASGQWMSASVRLNVLAGNRGTNAMQALGASLTYMKRYALGAMLGASTDEDVDGNGPQPTRKQKRQPAPSPKPQAPPPAEPAPAQPAESLWPDDAIKAAMNSKPFASAQDAIKWGYDSGVFKVYQHAENAYEKVRSEKAPSSSGEMWTLWRVDVTNRIHAKLERDELSGFSDDEKREWLNDTLAPMALAQGVPLPTIQNAADTDPAIVGLESALKAYAEK